MTLRKSSWKRLGLLALIVAVMFTFAACDSDNGDEATTPETYKISGTVTLDTDADVTDVSLAVEDEDETSSVTPESDGSWEATVVEGDVTVTPSLDGYTFDPSDWSDEVTSDESSIDFEGTEESTGEELTVESVSAIDDINVDWGTEFADLELPEEVTAVLSDESEETVPVTWAEGDYDGESADTYTLEGTIDVSGLDNVTNPDDVTASVDVVVAERDYDLEVTDVTDITTSSVEVEFEEVEEDMEDVTLIVEDPEGETVSVVAKDVLEGASFDIFEFEEELDEVAEGIWMVNGVEYDAKEAAAIQAVNDAVSADSHSDLLDALTVDYAEYFSDVNEDYIDVYMDVFKDSDDNPFSTVEEIQDEIEYANVNVVYGAAIIDAETFADLKSALEDADEAEVIERYNPDYIDEYWDRQEELIDTGTGDDYTEDADLDEVQAELIDYVNNAEAVAALETAFGGVDRDDWDDAYGPLGWVEDEAELTADHPSKGDNTTQSKEDWEADLDEHELLIDVDEADTDVALETSLQALVDDHNDGEDLDMDDVHPDLLSYYREAIADEETESNKNTVSLIAGIIDGVNDAIPTFDSALVENESAKDVVVTFDTTETLNGDDEAAFTVRVDGDPVNITDAATDTQNVTLTLEDPVLEGQSVRVSYDSEDGDIETAEDAAISFTNEVVDNDVVQEEFDSAVVGDSADDTIEITFTDDIQTDEGTTVADDVETSAFTVTVDGEEVGFSVTALDTDTATLDLTLDDGAVEQRADVNVSYDASEGNLTDALADTLPIKSFDEEVTNEVYVVEAGEITFDEEDEDTGKAEYTAGDDIVLTLTLEDINEDVVEVENGTYDVKVELYEEEAGGADRTEDDLLEVYHDEITFTEGEGNVTIEALTSSDVAQDVVLTVKDLVPGGGDETYERNDTNTDGDLTINANDAVEFDVEIADAADTTAVDIGIAAFDLHGNFAADYESETVVAQLTVERDGEVMAQDKVSNDGQVEITFEGSVYDSEGSMDMSSFIDELKEDDVLTVSVDDVEGSVTITEDMVTAK